MKFIKPYTLIILITCISACKKMVQVPEPIDTITTSETFASTSTATSEILGIYDKMVRNQTYADVYLSWLTGLSSDELTTFGSPTAFDMDNLQPDDNNSNNFWTPIYYNIYQANLAIEGSTASQSLTTQFKNQIRGEAEFVRAFCHFYLVNLFGDVPLVTVTSWQSTSAMARTHTAEVYNQIISDLTDAKNLLPTDYSLSNGERIRPNKWAATALLARAYLYISKWDSAELQATSVINNSALYSLDSLDAVFMANSTEAIWQLQPLYTLNRPYTTQEGYEFIPPHTTSSPNCYLSQRLLNAFETGDHRRLVWIDSTDFKGTEYYYPYKYQVRLGSQGQVPTEYTMVLRLAEQYLIRAEARAQQGTNLVGAINDLNILRERAWLPDLPLTLTQSEVLARIAQERRIELFAEYGHRWLDLKRTGQADAVLGAIKPTWKSMAQLYPIPLSELQRDPELVQNPGYQ